MHFITRKFEQRSGPPRENEIGQLIVSCETEIHIQLLTHIVIDKQIISISFASLGLDVVSVEYSINVRGRKTLELVFNGLIEQEYLEQIIKTPTSNLLTP